MDNYEEQRASGEHGWMWWNFFIGASAIAFALHLVPDADEWWEFATIAIMGVFALVVVIQGARSLIARRRAAAGREAVDTLEAGAPREPS